MSEKIFKKTRVTTELVKDGGDIFILIPSRKIGMQGKVPLTGRINEIPFSLTAIPWKKNTHALLLTGELKSRLAKDKDGHIVLEFEYDHSQRPEIQLPDDFHKVLGTNYEAHKKFDELSYYKQIGYIEWIDKAQSERDRKDRLSKIIQMILTDKLPSKYRDLFAIKRILR